MNKQHNPVSAKPKACAPYMLTFRLRPQRIKDYTQIYLRLQVRGSRRMSIGSGVFVTPGQWRPYKGQQLDLTFQRNETVEAKLDAIRDKIAAIYAQQVEISRIVGFPVTSQSVLWQFRGLSPVDGGDPGQRAAARPQPRMYHVGNLSGLIHKAA